MNFIDGIDISGMQGDIDAEKIAKAGFKFAYVKASQYSSTRDLKFDQYVKQLKAAGLHVGAYHFCFQGSDPEDQMKFFYNACEGLGSQVGDMPPMIDWEFCKNDAQGNPLTPNRCVEWLETASAKASKLWYPDTAQRLLDGFQARKPVIYTYPYFASQHQPLLADSGVWQYPLCYASYKSEGQKLVAWYPPKEGKTSPLHKLPAPWKDWTLWQYSGNFGTKVPGVGPDCDRQLFNGTYEDLLRFCGATELTQGRDVLVKEEES